MPNNDRVLLVGDRRQHEAVEAGRPFAQLQDAGMKTVKLEEIVRQKDPELKQVVEQMVRGEVREAIQNLDQQGRVHEIQGHDERIAAIAKEYAKSPENTLVISPDNRSRMEINERIHAELQRSGLVSNEEHRIRTLVPRQDLTGADRTGAERYQVRDVLRYSRASKETGIGKGAYAQVKNIDAPKNRLTAELNEEDSRFKAWLEDRHPQVKLLLDEEVSIGGVNFFGGTMWTDFNGGDLRAMETARSQMNDYRLIYNSDETIFTPADSIALHKNFASKLLKWFGKNLSGPRVVISHNAPVINPNSKFKGGPLAPAFNSLDMVEIIETRQPALWVYGHTHECDDQTIGRTRIISNQRGFPTLAVLNARILMTRVCQSK